MRSPRARRARRAASRRRCEDAFVWAATRQPVRRRAPIDDDAASTACTPPSRVEDEEQRAATTVEGNSDTAARCLPRRAELRRVGDEVVEQRTRAATTSARRGRRRLLERLLALGPARDGVLRRAGGRADEHDGHHASDTADACRTAAVRLPAPRRAAAPVREGRPRRSSLWKTAGTPVARRTSCWRSGRAATRVDASVACVASSIDAECARSSSAAGCTRWCRRRSDAAEPGRPAAASRGLRVRGGRDATACARRRRPAGSSTRKSCSSLTLAARRSRRRRPLVPASA